MNAHKFFSIILLFFIFTSCGKDQYTPGIDSLEKSGANGFKIGEDEENAINRLRQAALIVAKSIESQSVREVVIYGVRSGLYSDESIAFGDLLNNERSPVYKDIESTSFKNKFTEALETGDYYNSHEYGVKVSKPKGDEFDLKGFLISNQIQIYWPYSNNWDKQDDVNPIISFDPISNDTLGEGFQIIALSNGKNSIKKIVVNDALAQKTPVWILNFNDRHEVTDQGEYIPKIKKDKERIPNANKTLPQTRSSCGPTNMSVFIGEIKYFKDYDGLFGGGPEFRFFGGTVTIDGQGQVSGAMPSQFEINVRRSHRYSWANCGNYWDTQWAFSKEEQPIAVIEENTGGSLTQSIGGNVKVTIPNPGGGGGETTHTVSVQTMVRSEDEVIYVQTYDRCWYYTTAQGSTPFENRNGWNVHGATGQVKWTMPYSQW